MKTAKRTAVGKTVSGRYGEYEIIGFQGPWRIEIYRPREVSPLEPWNKEIRERHMCAGSLDDSTTVLGDSYNAKCGACYLNISHTLAYHEREMRDAGACRADETTQPLSKV